MFRVLLFVVAVKVAGAPFPSAAVAVMVVALTMVTAEEAEEADLHKVRLLLIPETFIP